MNIEMLASNASTAAPPLMLGRVVVLVHDYEAALDFYRTAFGAHVLFDGPSPTGDRYLHLGFGARPEGPGTPVGSSGAGVWLLRARGEDRARVGSQTGGQPLAVFYTPDVREALRRVEAAGGAVARPLVTAEGASVAHVTDLYGNEYVLVQLVPDAS